MMLIMMIIIIMIVIVIVIVIANYDITFLYLDILGVPVKKKQPVFDLLSLLCSQVLSQGTFARGWRSCNF